MIAGRAAPEPPRAALARPGRGHALRAVAQRGYLARSSAFSSVRRTMTCARCRRYGSGA